MIRFCILALSAAALVAQPASQTVAEAMVASVRSGGGSNFDRMMAVPSDQMVNLLNTWHPLYDSLAGGEVQTMVLMHAIFRQDSMYPSGKFDASASQVLTERLKTIPKEYVDSVTAAVKVSAGVAPDPAETVAYLMQLDGLFTGSSFTKVKGDRMLQRFRSLTTESVAQFAKMSGVPAKIAPFAMVHVAQIFRADLFQASVFSAALPEAERLFASK